MADEAQTGFWSTTGNSPQDIMNALELLTQVLAAQDEIEGNAASAEAAAVRAETAAAQAEVTRAAVDGEAAALITERVQAEAARDQAVAARDATITARDTTLAYRDDALGAVSSSGTNALNANTARVAAEAARDAAVTAQGNASTSATNAANSATAAATSANNAATSATNAGNSQLAAENAAVAAEGSKNAAATSESNAQKWAENPEDVAVVTGQFSAKHWALKAQAAVGGSLTLDGLADVNTSGVTNGQALVFNGTSWVPGTVSGGSSGPSKAFYTLTYAGGNFFPNMTNNLNFDLTITAAGTLGAPTGASVGETYHFRLGGTGTWAFNAAYDFGVAGAPQINNNGTVKDLVIALCIDAATPKFMCTYWKGA